MAKLTPPYPPLHSIEDAFELIQQSIGDYGVERQSGREILDGMFFSDTAQSVGADAVGLENTGHSVDEPMAIDDTETARTAVKAIYDATIRAGEGVSSVPTPDAREHVVDATGLGPTPASNMIERLESVGAITQRSTADGLEVSVTPEGRETIGLQTGSGGSGGSDEHRYMLRQVYEWGTRLGYSMELPTQDGDELPDAVGEIPPDVLPPSGFDALSDDEREQLLRARLESEYEEILDLSGTDTLYIEVESKGLTKPGGPIKNAAKAPSPDQLLFVVGDGGSDNLNKNAKRLARIVGVDADDPYVSSRTPADASRKVYTRNRITMNSATVEREQDRFAVVPGDASTEWIERPGGEIICRERGGGETFIRFSDVEAFRERKSSDAPTTGYYDVDRDGYALEIDGDLERVYGSKNKLTDDWSWVYEPLVPEAMFDDHGHDEIPEPEAFRIAIVPNDDRNVDDDLLMYDVEADGVDTVCESIGGLSDTEVLCSEDTESEVFADTGDTDNSDSHSLAEARAVAGKADPTTSEDDDLDEESYFRDDDEDCGFEIARR